MTSSRSRVPRLVFLKGRRRGSPPGARLSRKRRAPCLAVSIPAGRTTVGGVSKTGFSTSPPHSPCNMYIGENFAVRLRQNAYFRLTRLVTDEHDSGLALTEFSPFKPMARMSLSDHAQKIRNLPNAGGNSVTSEVLSFEMLRRCFNARLLKTEMEVTYFPEGGSITDYTCTLFDTTLGVSVTRAMKYRGDFTTEDATKLLNKKLSGINQSSRNSLDPWTKQILHVWAASTHVARVIAATFETDIDSSLKSNTMVLVTVASEADEIFSNPPKKKRGAR